jgi:hypothetical protein
MPFNEIPRIFRGMCVLPVNEGTLILPPTALDKMPYGGVIRSFLGLAAVRYATPAGTFAVFLHDLSADDIARLLTSQRYQAEAQLGTGYATSGRCRGQP